VLIAIARKELQLEASMYTCLQILSVAVVAKNQLTSALRADSMPENPDESTNQLNLFEI